MKTNICLVSLNVEFAKNIALNLSTNLDMYFADVDDLLQFDLIDVSEAEKLCGKTYINELKRKKVKTVCGFENTIITLNYDMLRNVEVCKLIKKSSLLVFINQPKKDYVKGLQNLNKSKAEIKICKSVYSDRTTYIKQISDVVVDTKKIKDEDIMQNLVQGIENFYK